MHGGPYSNSSVLWGAHFTHCLFTCDIQRPTSCDPLAISFTTASWLIIGTRKTPYEGIKYSRKRSLESQFYVERANLPKEPFPAPVTYPVSTSQQIKQAHSYDSVRRKQVKYTSRQLIHILPKEVLCIFDPKPPHESRTPSADLDATPLSPPS